MNSSSFYAGATRRPVGFPGAMAGVLLAAISTFAIAGRGDSPPPGDPGGGGGPPGLTDDESIGSLPMLGGDIVFLTPGAPGFDLPPSFYVEGPTARILDALIDAEGVGHVSLRPTPVAGRSVAVIYGDLHIDLDATLFTDDEVTSGLVVGAELGHVAAGLFHDGRLVSRAVIAPLGRFEVPIGDLYQLGVLKDGVDLFAARVRGGRGHVRITSHGGVISLQQMN